MHAFRTDSLETEIIDRALVIRFTRPEIRNSLSVAVLGSINQIIEACAVSKGIQRIVFTGSDDVFASGADLREIAAIVTCSPKITPVGRQESNKMRKGDSCDEKGTYGRADRWDNAWV